MWSAGSLTYSSWREATMTPTRPSNNCYKVGSKIICLICYLFFDLCRYHPFYISDSSEGGFSQKKEEDRRKQRVFAGVAYDNEGYPYPTAGIFLPFCNDTRTDLYITQICCKGRLRIMEIKKKTFL